MNPASRPRNYYRHALHERAVWLRAAKLGLVVGLAQVLLNQGDHWFHHQVDAAVVIKSILSPLLSFAIAFASAFTTHVENLRRAAAPISS
jgi:hypothetical protein